jgi:hypothetical protein
VDGRPIGADSISRAGAAGYFFTKIDEILGRNMNVSIAETHMKLADMMMSIFMLKSFQTWNVKSAIKKHPPIIALFLQNIPKGCRSNDEQEKADD